MTESGASFRSVGRQLDCCLAAVRRRRTLRRILEGMLAAATIGTIVALAAAGFMAIHYFAPGVVDATRTAVYFFLPAVLLIGAAWFLPQGLNHAAVARYVEDRLPDLDALIISAAEARQGQDGNPGAPKASPALAERLIKTAAETLASSAPLRQLERVQLRRVTVGFSILGALILAIALGGPEPLRYGLKLLVSPTADAAAANPFVIHVQPGNDTRLAGDDVKISAVTEWFDPDQLTLVALREDGSELTRTALVKNPVSGEYETFLFDVSESFDYAVVSTKVHSDRYHVDVVVKPVARRVDLKYEFPEETGRPAELVTGGTDISAVKGTRVQVRVTPDQPTATGRLVLDNERTVELENVNGRLQAEIEVQENGRYHVELAAPKYGFSRATPEYAITAHEDTLPTLELVKPGRDVKVTSIEEILIEANARDDVGVRGVELVLSVNGQDEEVIPLANNAASRTSVQGQHTLILEERGLEPGDLIAYHLRTRDVQYDADREVLSDIYFMEVRPFDTAYRRAPGGGGGRGGRGGNGGEEVLSAQQRALVVALFKLKREQGDLAEAELIERIEFLRTAQTRIRGRVDAIVRRIATRSIIELTPAYRRIAEELPKAAQTMVEVEKLLELDDVTGALPAARTALFHLQRADAAIREAWVAQSQRGAGQAAANDLANLFRLELDRFRNQYEDVRRGDWRPQQERVDETLKKLEELARRQQRELERSMIRGSQGDPSSQQALAAQVEALLRELERLTRNQPQSPLRETARDIESAARAMRRAADQGDSKAQAEALDRLRQAQQRLREAQNANQPGNQRQAGRDGQGERERLSAEMRGNVRTLERTSERLSDQLRRAPRPGAGGRSAGDETNDLADLRRSLSEQTGRIESLAEAMRREGVGSAGELDPLLDALTGLSGADALAPELLAERTAKLLSQLKAAERALRAKTSEPIATASTAVRHEPGPEQRAIVETYYRNLSERPGASDPSD